MLFCAIGSKSLNAPVPAGGALCICEWAPLVRVELAAGSLIEDWMLSTGLDTEFSYNEVTPVLS